MSTDEQRVAHFVSSLKQKFSRRQDAIQEPIRIGPTAVEATMQVLNEKNIYAKIAAATVLGSIKDARALDSVD